MDAPKETANDPLARYPLLDEAISCVRNWARSLQEQGRITAAYLFGSSINERGLRFESHASDLDIIVVVDWESREPLERFSELQKLKKDKHNLELQLLQILQRDSAKDSIVSLIPITPWELSHAIHKDGNSVILNSTSVLDLINDSELALLVPKDAVRELPVEHRQSIQFIQKTRSAFLSVSPNGADKFKIPPHDDPVPKELMRHFAIATADLEKDGGEIADLTRGLNELALALIGTQKGGEAQQEFSGFARWLGVRRGARGTVDPTITNEFYFIAVELAFDRIVQQYNSGRSISVAPKATGGTAASVDRLQSTFLVTTKGELGRTQRENNRAVANARANMIANVEPYFEVFFEEDAEDDRLLATTDSELTDAEHRKKLVAFGRRAVMSTQQDHIFKGIKLILWYGETLFPGIVNAALQPLLTRTIRAWVSNYSKAGFQKLGGGHDAWHQFLYPENPVATSFTSRLGSDSDVSIAATGRVVDRFSDDVLATSFVPEVISMYLRCESALEKLTRGNVDSIFETAQWLFGPH